MFQAVVTNLEVQLVEFSFLWHDSLCLAQGMVQWCAGQHLVGRSWGGVVNPVTHFRFDFAEIAWQNPVCWQICDSFCTTNPTVASTLNNSAHTWVHAIQVQVHTPPFHCCRWSPRALRGFIMSLGVHNLDTDKYKYTYCHSEVLFMLCCQLYNRMMLKES